MIQDYSTLSTAFDIGYKILGIIISVGVGAWGLNKMWLSTIYQTKKESESALQQLKREMHTNSLKTSDEIHSQNEKLNRMERDSEVFKTKYNGDMDLLKLQITNQTNIMQDIAHKVNNIANIKIANIVEMMIDEELKKRKI